MRVRSTGKIAGRVAIVAIVLILALWIRIAIAIDWRFEAVRSVRGVVAVVVSYAHFVREPTADKPWPYKIEVRNNGERFHVSFLETQPHFGGSIDYEIDRRNFRLLARYHGE